ncbi:LacI family DNA-binding transcriptional regulator [Cohnella candidum]|uniref:LacI family DNA-binding transcriptional regulator n=1 Tax=Cohnella candidum TaxID=2674991 RepID=A0A3G3JTS6_9BACL|nr:LacI family DNA-binding transcriptional regulator [Cohnella candidum]AYQ71616.1 LacI family DNA-binding transcriptional regulator [Cohnella candidum]
MNIKEIADKAGVSIATVSHVVNKTRYVSAELTERVLKVIEETDGKPGFLLRNKKSLKSVNILCLADNITDYFCVDVIKGLRDRARLDEMRVVVLHSDNIGLIHEYIRLEKPAGVVFLMGGARSESEFDKMKEIGIPAVFVGQADSVTENGNIVFDAFECAFKAVHHLLKSGHDRVAFVYQDKDGPWFDRKLLGYREALNEQGIPFDPSLVVAMEDLFAYGKHEVEDILADTNRTTAILCADEAATTGCLKFMGSHNLKCPEDLSLVSLHDFQWGDLLSPPITTVSYDPAEIGRKSFEKLIAKIKRLGEDSENTVVESKIKVRSSTQTIAKGPLGEKAESPELLHLQASEMESIKTGEYTAAISFHYSGTAWARLHEKGIKDVFAEMGIKVLVVTDAHFDPELQNKQHESILSMKPDILISVPVDGVMTAASYRTLLNAGIKLVLINNVPEGFERGDYVTCVSVNERENGQIAGRLLGEYLKRYDKKKIGLLVHGAPFFATRQRDQAVEQVLTEEFPDLEIVAVQSFQKESRAFDACYEMIKNHPEIEGLYVSWEGPALSALNALRELNREEIRMVTADLDSEVALNLAAGGSVIGISAQRPYDQGRAIALAAANALLGRSTPSYIGVSPYRVTRDNLLIAWQEILKERAPAQLASALKGSRNP